ncbi:hypothetical protein BC833DRAFT_619441 [Globomyces pollinis-pini]|nr:hypothetical protein BC833DRAFT_619441 [Globomyces pollinis-pini]
MATNPDNQSSNSQSALEEGVAKHRWTQRLGDLEWQLLFPNVSNTARTPIEQQLYWKLLHRRLPVNAYLKAKNGVIPNKSCTSCSELETIEHAFYECPDAQSFWRQFREFISIFINMSLNEFPPISIRDVIFFFPELRQLLVAEELHVLRVCHSVALWALWSMRSFPSSSPLLWACFQSRLESRIYLEYQQSYNLGKSVDLDHLLDGGDPLADFANRWCLPGSPIRITSQGIVFYK